RSFTARANQPSRDSARARQRRAALTLGPGVTPWLLDSTRDRDRQAAAVRAVGIAETHCRRLPAGRAALRRELHRDRAVTGFGRQRARAAVGRYRERAGIAAADAGSAGAYAHARGI